MDVTKPCETGQVSDCDECPYYDVFGRQCKLDPPRG